jgi:4-hydroxy-3-methylbut-2-enyl diphosphate reductase
MTPTGEQLIPFSELSAADIVIVPAFGTTLALYQQLRDQGVVPETYDATCPFVEKVWNRSEVLGRQGYTIVIHGKSYHEETRATFSHAEPFGPSVVIRDRAEAEVLVRAINGRISDDEFAQFFAGKTTRGFLASRDLRRIGVVNQTTMLARETTEIAALLRDAIVARYGVDAIGANFADTRDTLCYATNQNQDAVEALVELGGDCAIVVGGYNSSNTTQLVKICESSVPVYHVKDAGELLSIDLIRHFHGPSRRVIETPNWLPSARPLTILVTAGASCPDALVDAVITRVASFMGVAGEIPRAIKSSLSSAS